METLAKIAADLCAIEERIAQASTALQSQDSGLIVRQGELLAALGKCIGTVTSEVNRVNDWKEPGGATDETAA